MKNLCFIKNKLGCGHKPLDRSFGPYITPNFLLKKFKNINQYETNELNNEPSFDTINNIQRYRYILKSMKYIKEKNDILNKKYKNIINIGGDQCISLGSISSNIEKYNNDLQIVWIDSSPDIYNIDIENNDNMNNMVNGILLDTKYKYPKWIKKIKPGQLLYIGLRDINNYEKKILNDNKIRYITMDMINNFDFQDLLYQNDLIKYNNIHISIDVSVIDKTVMPSTNNPKDNGLFPYDIIDIIKYYKDRIRTIDFTELNIITDGPLYKEHINSVEISRDILKNIIHLYD